MALKVLKNFKKINGANSAALVTIVHGMKSPVTCVVLLCTGCVK